MATVQNPPLDEMISGALNWWREAGVDHAFTDEPIAWLMPRAAPQRDAAPDANVDPARKVEARAAAMPAPPVPAVPSLDPASLPGSLDVFARWWLSEPQLAEGALSTRVPPRGVAGAELMVIVPEPEREDSDTILSGPQGRLLDAMLTAFGLDPAQTYFASAIPRHLPGADWAALEASGLGLALRKHIALVAPKRIAVFGGSILPLLGHAPPQGPADLRIINHEGPNVPMLACRSLAALLEKPRWKAGVWQAWLELTG
jgi:uracil-DNA glycosylase